ncbi:hypothetical protein [Oceanirhabdus sp. W0125-5]|uniref:hypothetical protein n=1 Tax=Oceanirhabdus sp. W0125-5 TaxID=2999116 RepID=UPI0022F2AB01|nr:hypothetical protein [Oceanirhabdus sp. W0125-5]WBW95455.1 hypothetical protein OW730_17390 [Oceanirhabdus sp. W0125-5]
MILIHSAGNKKIGIGNLSRCSTIAKEIVKISREELIILYETSVELSNKFSVENAKTYRVRDRNEALSLIEILSKEYKEQKNIVTDLLDLTYKANVATFNR